MSIIKSILRTDGQRLRRRDATKVAILTVLVLLCMGVAYYAYVIIHINVVYTHLFYIPILVAGFWWGRRAIWVAIFLGGWLIACHALSDLGIPYTQDLLRAGTFIVVSVMVGTLRKQGLKSERTLRETRDYLESLINYANAPIIVWDPESRITQFNHAFERLTGYTADEVIGKELSILFPEASRGESLIKIERTLTGEYWESVEIPILRKDGNVWLALWNSANIYAEDSTTLLATIAQGQDITERKWAEDDLRKVNRALMTLSECNQELVRATDESGLLHDICRILVEIGKYRLAWVGFADQDEEKSVRLVAQVGYEEGYLDTLNITWADTEQGRGPTGTAIRTGKHVIARNILIDPDYAPWRAEATKRGYAASIAVPLIANGQTLGALNIYAVEPDVFDADEVKLLRELADDLAYGIRALRSRAARKQAEETLRTSEEKYRTLIDNIQDGIFIIQDAEMQFVNNAFARILGYTVEEVTGMDFRQLIAHEDVEIVTDRYRRRQAGEDVPSEYEFRVLHKDGVSRVIVNMNVGLVDYQGRVASMGTLKDVTEQRRAREALREAEEKYRMIVEDQTELISRFLPDGTRTFVNEAYCQYFGKVREELLGQRFTSYTLKEDLAKEENGLASLTQDSPVIMLETRITDPNGKIRWVQWTDRAQFDAQGNLVAYQSVGRDITERKQAEKALCRERDLAEALAEATAALTATLDFERVLDGILEQLGRVVPNDAANIMLIKGDQARIVRGRGYERFGTEEFVSTIVYRISEVRNLQQMLESGDPLVIPDTSTYPGWTHSPETKWLRSYAASPIVVRGEVIGFLNVDSATPGSFTQVHAEALRIFADHAAAAIENARLYEDVQQELAERVQVEEKLRLSFIQLAKTVSRAMESQDPYTAGHQRQVGKMSRAVGKKLGLDQERLLGLYVAGLLHDIGKISIPAEFLTHPGELTDAEWALIQTHPRRGYEILEQARFPWPVADMALHHHERLDGSGYPDGLKGDQLSLEVRILSVCDVVDAMSSHRPYRSARSKPEVMEELRACKGTKYDSEVVDLLVEIIEQGELGADD